MLYTPESLRRDLGDIAAPRLGLLFWQSVRLRDWTYSHLQAPYWRLYWNRKSGATLYTVRTVVSLTPDMVVLVPPETDFSSSIEGEIVHFYVHFLTSWVWQGKGPASLPLDSEEREVLSRVTDFRNPDTGDLRSNSWKILSLTGHFLSRLPESGWGRFTDPGSKIAAALETIHSHSPVKVPVERLARGARMNPSAFIRLFREKVGLTPARYMLEKRVEAACFLLHKSDRSIEEIACICGFSDRYHFTKQFSKVRGLTPVAFRRRTRP